MPWLATWPQLDNKSKRSHNGLPYTIIQLASQIVGVENIKDVLAHAKADQARPQVSMLREQVGEALWKLQSLELRTTVSTQHVTTLLGNYGEMETRINAMGGQMVSLQQNMVSMNTMKIDMHVVWVKGHAGFQGNKVADAFSKWAAFALQWSPSLPPPPPAHGLHIPRPPPRLPQDHNQQHQAPPPAASTHQHSCHIQLPFL